jgi:hypothetical protein
MNTVINPPIAEPLARSGVQNPVLAEQFHVASPEKTNGTNGNGTHGTSAGTIQWSWSCRRLASFPCDSLEEPNTAPPQAGDVALMRVEKTQFHRHLTTAENRRLRLYPGAQFVGVFGNRYACDAFEAEVLGTDNLAMLTAAGMIGTVKSKHHGAADPTLISLLGYIRDEEGTRLNLKNKLFRPTRLQRMPRSLILVVGTGMNCGKTTTAARLTNGLSNLGLNVAACKLTGSVSNRDQDELAAAASHRAIDFSDFGFPSTYLCSKEELLNLFHTMLGEVTANDPDVVLMELADGLVQRETAMLLADPEIKKTARGLVLSAESSLSALWGTERLRQLGYNVIAVSGKFTSSPLAMREYIENDSAIPVVSSADTGADLAVRVGSILSDE